MWLQDAQGLDWKEAPGCGETPLQLISPSGPCCPVQGTGTAPLQPLCRATGERLGHPSLGATQVNKPQYQDTTSCPSRAKEVVATGTKAGCPQLPGVKFQM